MEKRVGKRVLLGASYSVIEPLGLLHLSAIARQEGWEPKIALARKTDLSDLDRIVSEFNPDLFGFTLYTGNHVQAFTYLDRLRKSRPTMQVALGGPHATYFPQESTKHADFVVLSEGFHSFRRILSGQADRGIVHLQKLEPFPHPDRGGFYEDYPEHRNSPIKSIATQTGCPFSCTYCYNSSTLEGISQFLSEEQTAEMKQALFPLGRLFPKSVRSVEDIVKEIAEIKEVSPQTRMIYFQDDVFGSSLDWVRNFSKEFSPLGLSFHAQMRFETADPNNPKNKEMLELMREAGCTGLTFAIESADHSVRKEVLNRSMKEDLMFRVFDFLNGLGYKVRTEQMLGLPYGATSQKTKVNLEADLETLELNVRLKEATNLPTMAWASIFAPYRGTKIGDYCRKHGFYSGGNNDVPVTFFERSVLQFPRHWTGPTLSPESKDAWMPQAELELYRSDMQTLRDLFSVFALIPKGHKLAADFLSRDDRTYKGLSTATRHHLYDNVLYDLE